MKKLLLLSLLAMGATSFAAVEGTAARAEMPITVRGSVIDKTGTNLVIEPLKNAGVNGTSMEFDFGGIVQGQSQTLQGSFAIYKANATTAITDASTNIKVGMLNAAGTDVTATDTTTVGTNSKVTLGYAVRYSATPDLKRINGTIDVTANVADDAEATSFLDTSKKLAVLITTP